MAEKKEKEKWLNINDIKERITEIKGWDRYYISENGVIYKYMENDMYKKLKPYLNQKNGYMYQTLYKNGKKKKYRIHRLVAEYFVENVDGGDIVMHLDNNKTNNSYTNLKWGTVSENTKQAFDDELLINDKGYDDSQSKPIYVYDLDNNLLYDFGSISIASKELGIAKSTIARQCNGTSKGKPRCGYIFKYQSDLI